MPSELCCNFQGYRYCVHPESYDPDTKIALLSDPSDGLCFKYTEGERGLGKMECGDGALRFKYDAPEASMLLAIGTTGFSGEMCLEGWRNAGLNLWECDSPNKAKQTFFKTYRTHYQWPCAKPAVGNTNAEQCVCAPQQDKLYGRVGSKFLSYQTCLAGRVRGSLGGRTLTSMRPENMCNGQPIEMVSLADWTDENSMFVHWVEDTENFQSAASYINKVTFIDGEAKLTAQIKLSGCVQGGGITRGKGDTVVVLCAEHVDWDGKLHLKFVEVSSDLSSEVRRFSALPEDCHDGDCEGFYKMQGGADFRHVAYIPTKNWYVSWTGAGWGSHVADTMRMFDVTTTAFVPGAGDDWACMNGHTETGRMVYNADLDELGALCSSDTGGECTDPADSKQACDATNTYKNGMTYRTHVQDGKVGPITLAPFSNVWSQAISGWIGDIVPCADGFAIVWVGPDGVGTTFADDTNDVGFMRIKADGSIIVKKWVVGKTTATRERSAKLAKLGTGNCDRFLLGWGEMAADLYYPQKYQLVEIDSNGDQLTAPIDVTTSAQWAEETMWTTMTNGDVAWAHTWRRNADGSPSVVGKSQFGAAAGKTCTYDGNGYGYSWGSDPTQPGRRFHTNEAFMMRYKADVTTAAPPTPAPPGSTEVPTTDVPPTAVPSTVAPLTNAPATDAPATDAPRTVSPPTEVPPTLSPGSTAVPTTNAPPTAVPSTAAPSTAAPLTTAPATDAPRTMSPPTEVPPTLSPGSTAVPTAIPTAIPTSSPGVPPTNTPGTASQVSLGTASALIAKNWWTAEGASLRDVDGTLAVRQAAGTTTTTITFSPKTASGNYAYLREAGGWPAEIGFYDHMVLSIRAGRLSMGVLVVRLTTRTSSEDDTTPDAGGKTFLHRYRVRTTTDNTWQTVVVDRHPDEIVSEQPSNGNDYGVIEHALQAGGVSGAYFDYVTQIAISFESTTNHRTAEVASAEGDTEWAVGDVSFVHSDHTNDINAVYAMTGSAVRDTSTKRVRIALSWARNKDAPENTPYEVRYSYEHSVHSVGFSAAVFLTTVTSSSASLMVLPGDADGTVLLSELAASTITNVHLAVRAGTAAEFTEINLVFQDGTVASDDASDGGNGVDTELVVGLAVGGGLCLIIPIVIAVVLLCKKEKMEEGKEKNTAEEVNNAPDGGEA